MRAKKPSVPGPAEARSGASLVSVIGILMHFALLPPSVYCVAVGIDYGIPLTVATLAALLVASFGAFFDARRQNCSFRSSVGRLLRTAWSSLWSFP